MRARANLNRKQLVVHSRHPACFLGLQHSRTYILYFIYPWIKVKKNKKKMSRKEEYDSYEIEEPSDEERACSR